MDHQAPRGRRFVSGETNAGRRLHRAVAMVGRSKSCSGEIRREALLIRLSEGGIAELVRPNCRLGPKQSIGRGSKSARQFISSNVREGHRAGSAWLPVSGLSRASVREAKVSGNSLQARLKSDTEITGTGPGLRTKQRMERLNQRNRGAL